MSTDMLRRLTNCRLLLLLLLLLLYLNAASQLPLRCLRTFVCVEDGAIMHTVALTYQPEFTVIRDPSCQRLSQPRRYCKNVEKTSSTIRLGFV